MRRPSARAESGSRLIANFWSERDPAQRGNKTGDQLGGTEGLAGTPPEDLIGAAQEKLGVAGTPRADAVKASLLRNLDILGKLGCLEPAGMAKLETSNAPTITRGPYAGDIASVDHIIPRSVCEELDERLYNLEFMPSKMNSCKGNKVTLRQVQLARKWNEVGLLSESGLRAVERARPD